MKRLIIVVPCYNEEEVFAYSSKLLNDTLTDLIQKGKIADNSSILYVNDGSTDSTWSLICEEQKNNDRVIAVGLAGNVGHQNALLAGLDVAKDICDMSISIDADLQDDVAAIEKMVDCYYEGCDIVFGVRDDRSSDSAFKRSTAQGFYKFMQKMDVKTVYNHADFRLLSSRAMKQLLMYKEQNVYLRGLVMKLGYKTDCVYYARKKRTAGETKYNFSKMADLALNGITSFSIKPVNYITVMGLVIILLSLAAAVISTVLAIIHGYMPILLVILLSMWFLAGLVIFSLGIIGQYVARNYIESKHRPRYNIQTVLDHEQK